MSGVELAPLASLAYGEISLMYSEAGLKLVGLAGDVALDAKIASSIVGAMVSNGVMRLNEMQLNGAMNSALQMSKYNNMPALLQALRNASPLKGYFQ